ncbi:MAG: ribose-phosphate pyrophosphokinase [Eubacteriales bacterium]|nr:ribose-phosphate pyrophosphokinase [Eubacteriales bacterium]
MAAEEKELSRPGAQEMFNAPIGHLGLIPLKGCEALAEQIDDYLIRWRNERETAGLNDGHFLGYPKGSYVVKTDCPRFGSGEGKGVIKSSVRGDDLYFLSDVTNNSLTYTVAGETNHYSPDDHFADLKRLIAASAGRAKRMTVIMPFLYEGRVSKRDGRESLDCAQMLQELVDMGVTNILTFEAHEPRVQNAIPLNEFETISPAYQYIKALLGAVDDLDVDAEHMMVISPDEGGMGRAIFFANLLGLDMGMFYKRKDYTKFINGVNPVVAHEFLGASVEGKDVVIVDDMISSGDRMVEVARELKRRKARRVFGCAAFGLFTGGFSAFDRAHDEGALDLLFTTNMIYQKPELLERSWYVNVDMAKYIALLIDCLNHDHSLTSLLSPVERVNAKLEEYRCRRNASKTE